MTTIFMNWADLKAKKTEEGMTFYYHDFDNRIQIYLIDDGNVFMIYLMSQEAIDDPNSVGGSQANLDDWTTNYLAGAIETEGVSE